MNRNTKFSCLCTLDLKNNFVPTNQPLDPNGWDGTLNGNLLDSGVYVYMLEVEFEDGTTEQYKGDITLLK